MDDLLKDFLQEAAEHLDATSSELLRFEKDQGDPALVASLFRHIHTIKGSSGFLNLPRVTRIAHATESLIGPLREGAAATPAHVSLIFSAIDRLAFLLCEIARTEAEPEGDDADVLQQIETGSANLHSGQTALSPSPQPAAVSVSRRNCTSRCKARALA